MAEEKNGAGTGEPPKGAETKPNDQAAKNDPEVTIKQSELDNFQKGRDEERELRKKAETALAQRLADEENAKKEAEQKEAEAKGEYQKVLDQTKAENETLKERAERLKRLEDEADTKNKADLELFKDEDEKSLVEDAIKGKDSLDAREIIKKFKAKFLGTNSKKSYGGKTQQNPDEVQVKKDELKELKTSLEALFTKQREKKALSPQDQEDLISIPKKILKLKKDLNITE